MHFSTFLETCYGMIHFHLYRTDMEAAHRDRERVQHESVSQSYIDEGRILQGAGRKQNIKHTVCTWKIWRPDGGGAPSLHLSTAGRASLGRSLFLPGDEVWWMLVGFSLPADISYSCCVCVVNEFCSRTWRRLSCFLRRCSSNRSSLAFWHCDFTIAATACDSSRCRSSLACCRWTSRTRCNFASSFAIFITCTLQGQTGWLTASSVQLGLLGSITMLQFAWRHYSSFDTQQTLQL